MRKNKLPNLVVVLIISLVTVIMWVSLNIFRALTIKPSPVVPEEISNPLDPTLKTEILGEIDKRILIDTSQIPETIATASPSPTPAAIVVPTESPTPISTPPEATESGTQQ